MSAHRVGAPAACRHGTSIGIGEWDLAGGQGLDVLRQRLHAFHLRLQLTRSDSARPAEMVRGRTKVASIDTKVAIDTFVQWFRFRRSGLMTAVEEKPICTMAAEVGNGGTAVNVDKERILAGAGRKPDPLLDLEKRHGDVDRESVLDLIAVIEDERRMRAAAAVLSSDTAVRERYRAQVREDSAMLASIRQGLARTAREHLSRREQARQLEAYACQLMVRSQQSYNHAPRSTTKAQGGQS